MPAASRRGGEPAPVAAGRGPAPWWETVLSGMEPGGGSTEDFWSAPAPIDEPHGSPVPPPAPDAVLRRLDALDLTVRGRPVVELLRPLYERFGEAAGS